MIQTRWYKSIEEIPETAWERIFGKSEQVKSYNFNLAVEKAAIEGVRHLWLVAFEKAVIQAIIPAFVFKAKPDTFAPGKIRQLMERIRVWFPGFLTVKIFFCGSPVAICDELWGIHPSATHNEELMTSIISSLNRKSEEENCKLTIIKEIPARIKDHFSMKLEKDSFVVAESLPNSFMPVNKSKTPFPTAFRTRYKRRIKRSYRDFIKHGYRWSAVKHFEQYADEMEDLYLQVLNRSNSKFEKLNADFFRSVNTCLKENVFAILCFNPGNKLVCFELVLEEPDTLIPLYVGIDYNYIEHGNLYFNCINRIIEEAEKKDKKWIVFGQTSYLAKAYTGSVFERLYVFIKARGLFWNKVLRYFSDALFPSCQLPSVRCYRKEIIPYILDTIKQKGLYNEPVKTPCNLD